MGESARWVCHDCKTVCSQGARPIFQGIPGDLSIADIDDLKRRIADLNQEVRVKDEDSMISFLDDLRKWLSRHEGHNVHIGSDYSTDMMDLDDYHNESVEGKVSDCTRHEARCKSVDEWEQTAINQIKQVIQSHATPKLTTAITAVIDVDGAARELYQKFSMKEI